jgi:hypothetical protein
MTKRKVALGLLVLLVTSGCLGGTPAPSEEDLAKDADYDWDTDATVTIDVRGGEYHTVANVSDQESVHLATSSGFGGRSPLYISAIRFRYANGTVVGPDAMSVYTSDSRTVVEFPTDNGTFAYTATAGSRSVTIPVGFEGSHEVVLPEGMRVSFPVFGVVEPAGYEKTVEDNRVHLNWESMNSDRITLKYYLKQDLLIFGSIVGLLAAVALGGVVYFRKRIRRLEAERAEQGLDVEE